MTVAHRPRPFSPDPDAPDEYCCLGCLGIPVPFAELSGPLPDDVADSWRGNVTVLLNGVDVTLETVTVTGMAEKACTVHPPFGWAELFERMTMPAGNNERFACHRCLRNVVTRYHRGMVKVRHHRPTPATA